MSYQKRIEEMVGNHVAEFQLKYTAARELMGHDYRPAMPYGYPLPVYRPLHVCRAPQFKAFIHHPEGALSNGVPKVLAMELIEGYPLGGYYPAHRAD